MMVRKSACSVLAGVLLLTAGRCALAQAGAELYAKQCAACHQAGGVGAPGLAPPLAGSLGRFAVTQPGRVYLAQVLVSGVSGKVDYHGPPYVGNMPSFKSSRDEDLAQMMGYVLGELNRDALPAGFTAMSAGEFADARAKAMAAREIKQLRRTALDPK